MDKKQREARRHQEDIALQRGLLWVVGAIVLEVLLVLVNRFYINYYLNEAEIFLALHKVLSAVRMAAPVATLLALVWTGWQVKQKQKFMLPFILTTAFGALSVCSHVAIKFRGPGVSMLIWLVIGWAVLAMVFYIYQHEFFLGAAACGMSILALWFVRYGLSGRPESFLVLAAIAVVTAAAFWLKKTDGALPNKEQFLPQETNYAVLLVTCVASLLAVVAAMLAGGTVAYYLIFVMIALLFALFVYYTVKLM